MGSKPAVSGPTTYSPPAPPTAANAAAVQAAADAKRKAAEKQGLAATLLAGQGTNDGTKTGNLFAPVTGNKNTLLGGG